MSTSATSRSVIAESWWRRLHSLLREQWIFAVILGLVWCGEVLLTVEQGSRALVAIPGFTLMLVFALFARRRPVLFGSAGALVLMASSVALLLAGVRAYSLGLAAILPTENIAGVAMVLYLFWLCPPRRAVPVTALLVLSCLAAIYLRTGDSFVYPGVEVHRAFGVGFLELVLAVGTGMYLRGKKPRSDDTPIQALLRRQWPVMAALFVILFLELVGGGDGITATVTAILGGAVMSVMAVLAPIRPARSAMLGALALVLMSVVMRVFGIEATTFVLGPVPPTAVAAGMILLAFTARHAEPRNAVWSGAALVGSALFAVGVMPMTNPYSHSGDVLNTLFMGGLLLVLAVGTGLYFRARDDERTTSVRTAITSAQQEERLALARELHDVVAHHLTGIVVQAQAAQMVSEKDPKASAEALERIAGSGTEALTAMRRLVASMRGAEPAGASQATEQATTDLGADVRAVVARAERHYREHEEAPAIHLSVDLGQDIPPEVTRSALRVVQESLTNVVRHALDVSHIGIRVDVIGSHLHTLVTDDGSGTHAMPIGGSGGYGLIGMRERVELLGGQFSAGPGEHTGWRVEAWLPLGEQTEEEDSE